MPEIDKLNFVMGMNTQGMTRGGKAVTRVFGKMDNRFKAVLGTVGLLSAVFIGFSIKAVKAASKFQDAFNEVRTLIDETTTDSKALSEEVLKLAVNVGRPPEEVSRGLYQVISAGVTDAAEAMDVLEIATKASIGGLTDQFTAVDALTTVLNAYNLEVTEAEHVTDLMLNAVKEGKLTFNDLASNIGKVASTAALAGVSFAEISAALATMTKAGLSTELATTSLNILLLKIIDSGPDVQRAAKDMGLEWNLAALKARGLTGLMEDLSRASGGSGEKMKSVVKEIEAFKGASILAGTGLKEFTRIMETTNDVAGTTQEFFDKIKQSVSETAKEISTRLTVAFIKLGNIVLPAIQSSLMSILSLIKLFTQTDLEKSIEALSKISGVEALVRRLKLQQQVDDEIIKQIENEKELNEFLKEKDFLLTRIVGLHLKTGEIIRGQLPPQLDALKRIIDISKTQEGINELLELEKLLRIEANETEVVLAEARLRKDKDRIKIAEEINRKIKEQLAFVMELLSLKSNVQLSDEKIAEKQKEINLLLEGGVKKQKKATEASQDTTKSITKQKEELEDKIELIKRGAAAEIALIKLTGRIERKEAADIIAEIKNIQDVTTERLSSHLAEAIRIYGAESLFVKELRIAIAQLIADAQEEIEVTIKTNLVLDGLDKSSRAVSNLGRELGVLSVNSAGAIVEVAGLADGISEFGKLSKDSSLFDKLIPGMSLVASGLSIMNTIFVKTEKRTTAVSNSADLLADRMRKLNDAFETSLDLQNLSDAEKLQKRLKKLLASGDLAGIPEDILRGFAQGIKFEDLFTPEQLRTSAVQNIIGILEGIGVEGAQAFINFKDVVRAALEDGIITPEEAQQIDDAISSMAEFPDLMSRFSDETIDALRSIERLTNRLRDLADAADDAAADAADAADAVIDTADIKREPDLDTIFPDIDDGGGILDPFINPETRSVRQFVGITELQSNLIIGILNTSRAIQQEILNVISDRLGEGGKGDDIGNINETLADDIENSERGEGVLS